MSTVASTQRSALIRLSQIVPEFVAPLPRGMSTSTPSALVERKPIGVGNFSQVYIENGYAVKEMREKTLEGLPNHSLLSELNAHKALGVRGKDCKHPGDKHVVRLRFHKDNKLYFDLVLLGGKPVTLKDYVKEPLSDEQTRRFLRHLVLGLDRLYISGVLHTDLSPRNCFIGEGSNKKPSLVIGDLGYFVALLPTPDSVIDIQTTKKFYEAQGPYQISKFNSLGTERNWRSMLGPLGSLLIFMKDPNYGYNHEHRWKNGTGSDLIEFHHRTTGNYLGSIKRPTDLLETLQEPDENEKDNFFRRMFARL